MRFSPGRALSFGAAIVLVAGSVVGPAVPASSTPSWTFGLSPNPAGAKVGAVLSSVVCLTTTSCVAVGNSSRVVSSSASITTTLIERFDRNSWSIVPSPSPGTDSSLQAVSCTAPGFCLAVGSRIETVPVTSSSTLVERWNGARWSIVPSANRAGYYSSLSDVSCRTSKDCVAVGSSSRASGNGLTLIEHWNGKTWSIAPSPSPDPDLTGAGLAGVSCTTASACVAVGSGGTSPLVEQWNGSTWSVVPSPRIPAGGQLRGVKCTSTKWCVAVGETDGLQSLVEQWDGTAWSIMASANRASQVHNELSAVKCVSASDCTAVGGPEPFDQFPGDRVIQHWDGVKWSIVANPVPSAIGFSSLAGVSCPSSANCVAVGYFMFAGFDFPKTLVVRSS